MPDKRLDFRIINWNIGGAKFLALPSSKDQKPNDHSLSREEFNTRMENALRQLITQFQNPHVITLQEVVQFNEQGDSTKPQNTFDDSFFEEVGYKFHFWRLIDTEKFSARMKWDKIKQYWKGCDNPYFAQGNAILVRKDMIKSLFPVWTIPDIPAYGQTEQQSNSGKNPPCDNEIECASEMVYVEQGLYFGDRNTEPRAAIVTHFVLDGTEPQVHPPHQSLDWPIDLFVVNLHLTTLLHEREGIPSIDIKASERRLKQLDIVFNDIISRYNSWQKETKYQLSGKPYPEEAGAQTTRNSPVWIVAGDFNFTPTSAEFDYITKRNFMSLCKGLTKSKGLGEAPTLTVDYVFGGCLYDSILPQDIKDVIDRPDRNITWALQAVAVSDHYPLCVDVPIRVNDKTPEIVAIVDENDMVVGSCRRSRHANGNLHRETSVIVVNENGEILIQTRKKSGKLDFSASGHVHQDEAYEQGALRELKEEIGLEIEKEELHFIDNYRINYPGPPVVNNRFISLFQVKGAYTVEDMIIDPTEVQKVAYYPVARLKEIMSEYPECLSQGFRQSLEIYFAQLE